MGLSWRLNPHKYISPCSHHLEFTSMCHFIRVDLVNHGNIYNNYNNNSNNNNSNNNNSNNIYIIIYIYLHWVPPWTHRSQASHRGSQNAQLTFLEATVEVCNSRLRDLERRGWGWGWGSAKFTPRLQMDPNGMYGMLEYVGICWNMLEYVGFGHVPDENNIIWNTKKSHANGFFSEPGDLSSETSRARPRSSQCRPCGASGGISSAVGQMQSLG